MSYTSTSISEQHSFSGLSSRDYYWSPELLSSFTFLMSGHGVPVCASMMLGDADYAREQLRLACTFEDRSLQHLAVEMLSEVAHLNPARSTSQWSH